MFRSSIRGLAGVLVLTTATLASPDVQAQALPSRHEVAFGISAIPYLEDAGALPIGWLVAYAQADGDSHVGFVAEAAGSYSTGGGSSRRMYTVQGGVRFMPRTTAQVRPFGQFLAGIMSVGCCGESYGYFSIEPGGGVDLLLTDRLGLRVAGAMPIAFSGSESARAVRVQLALVLGWGGV